MVRSWRCLDESRDRGTGTLYFWPYLVNSDLTSLSPLEMADLNALGYSMRRSSR